MSSNYRDVGETLADISRIIPTDLGSVSEAELRNMLRKIKEIAQEGYVEYAVFMGWADSKDEALKETLHEDDDEKEPPSAATTQTVIAHSWFQLTKWCSEKKRIPLEFDDLILFESEKGFLTKTFNWIPKSQIVIKRDIEWKEVPPYECVPWFEEKVHAGDSVLFYYHGGLGGVYPVSGLVIKMDAPQIDVFDATGNVKSCTMGNIQTFIKFKAEKGEHEIVKLYRNSPQEDSKDEDCAPF